MIIFFEISPYLHVIDYRTHAPCDVQFQKIKFNNRFRNIHQGLEMYSRIKSNVYLLIASDPEKGGFASRFFDVCLIALIIANVLAVILETVQGFFLPNAYFFYAFDVFSVAAFSIEYILRLWTCT